MQIVELWLDRIFQSYDWSIAPRRVITPISNSYAAPTNRKLRSLRSVVVFVDIVDSCSVDLLLLAAEVLEQVPPPLLHPRHLLRPPPRAVLKPGDTLYC